MAANGVVLEFSEELRGKRVAYRFHRRLDIIDYDDGFENLLEKLRRRGIDTCFVQVDYVPGEDFVFLLNTMVGRGVLWGT